MNRKIEYALIALKYMRHKNADEVTSAKEICAMYEIPFDPKTGNPPDDTGYTIFADENGYIHAAAVGEAVPTISIVR